MLFLNKVALIASITQAAAYPARLGRRSHRQAADTCCRRSEQLNFTLNGPSRRPAGWRTFRPLAWPHAMHLRQVALMTTVRAQGWWKVFRRTWFGTSRKSDQAPRIDDFGQSV